MYISRWALLQDNSPAEYIDDVIFLIYQFLPHDKIHQRRLILYPFCVGYPNEYAKLRIKSQNSKNHFDFSW